MTSGISKSALSQIIHNEITYLAKHDYHPKIHSDIDAVWIFSGPGTFYQPLDSGEPTFMAWEDRYRILYGISLARKVTAIRMGKNLQTISDIDMQSRGPIIIYNGIPSENADFRKAIYGKDHIYPSNKVRIVDVVSNGDTVRTISNTLDQIKSFPKKEIGRSIHRRVAVISHAAHLARIIRYFKQYKIFPEHITVELFSVRESKKNLMMDAQEETEKIWKYFLKGDLSWDPFPVEV